VSFADVTQKLTALRQDKSKQPNEEVTPTKSNLFDRMTQPHLLNSSYMPVQPELDSKLRIGLLDRLFDIKEKKEIVLSQDAED
jgi:hypothetical protein